MLMLYLIISALFSTQKKNENDDHTALINCVTNTQSNREEKDKME